MNSDYWKQSPPKIDAKTALAGARLLRSAPANAFLLNCGADDLRRAKLVVGGHATAMRALRHGVPIVAIPEFAGDQPGVAGVAIRRTIRRRLAGPSLRCDPVDDGGRSRPPHAELKRASGLAARRQL